MCCVRAAHFRPVSSDTPTADGLAAIVRETEQHVATGGWDQGPRLFALARNADLRLREPELAASLEVPDDGWTAIEQDEVDAEDLESFLARLAWPDEVDGIILVLERIVLPPTAEHSLPSDSDNGEFVDAAMSHPDREDVRIAVGVLRDGRRATALRVRHHDDDALVAIGPDLVPGLADHLAATFSE